MSVPLSRPLMQVSVLLATRRRAELLGQTLAAMAHMSTVDLAWELVVVDNEGETTTREVCESFADRLPLRYLVCRTPGQNAARNYGLGAVRGGLVVLSDDDMLPDADWLRELYQGAKRWPEQSSSEAAPCRTGQVRSRTLRLMKISGIGRTVSVTHLFLTDLTRGFCRSPPTWPSGGEYSSTA